MRQPVFLGMFVEVGHEVAQPPAEDAFSGPAYVPEFDHARLTGQLRDIYTLMADGQWRTLREISAATGHGEASASAQLRNLRKPKFGGFTVDSQYRGDRKRGLFEYRMVT